MSRFTWSLVISIASASLLLPKAAHSQDHAPAAEGVAHAEMDPTAKASEEAPAFEDDPGESPRESFLLWFVGSLGWKFCLIAPPMAMLSFILVGLLLLRGKGPHTGMAIGFLVAMPGLIGLCALLDSLIAVYMVLAQSAATPKYSEIATGWAVSLVAPLVSLILSVPTYLLATVGLTIRALKGEPKG